MDFLLFYENYLYNLDILFSDGTFALCQPVIGHFNNLIDDKVDCGDHQNKAQLARTGSNKMENRLSYLCVWNGNGSDSSKQGQNDNGFGRRGSFKKSGI